MGPSVASRVVRFPFLRNCGAYAVRLNGQRNGLGFSRRVYTDGTRLALRFPSMYHTARNIVTKSFLGSLRTFETWETHSIRSTISSESRRVSRPRRSADGVATDGTASNELCLVHQRYRLVSSLHPEDTMALTLFTTPVSTTLLLCCSVYRCSQCCRRRSGLAARITTARARCVLRPPHTA